MVKIPPIKMGVTDSTLSVQQLLIPVCETSSTLSGNLRTDVAIEHGHL